MTYLTSLPSRIILDHFSIYNSAFTLASCPYSTLMAGTLESRLWTTDEIISSMQCYDCFRNTFNRWGPCMTKNAQTNIDPYLCSRPRQIWYLVFNYLKFLKPNNQFDDADFTFQGEDSVIYHSYSLVDPACRTIKSNVPKSFQIDTIIARGKLYYANILKITFLNIKFRKRSTRTCQWILSRQLHFD